MNSLIVCYSHYGNTAVAAARVLDNMAKFCKVKQSSFGPLKIRKTLDSS